MSKAVIGAFGDSITVIEKSNDKIIFDNGTLDNDSYFEKQVESRIWFRILFINIGR